jgi:hypothetical protein
MTLSGLVYIVRVDWIMSTSKKNSNCDHVGKALKPSPRSLLKAIEGATKDPQGHTQVVDSCKPPHAAHHLEMHSLHQAKRWTTPEQKPR